MIDKARNVLFLCTHISALSILAEAMLNHIGQGRFRAYSASSQPRDKQRPNAPGAFTPEEGDVAVDAAARRD